MPLSRFESKAIASRYVAAIFDVAKAQSRHEKLGDDLSRLAEIITTNDALQRLLSSPVIGVEAKCAVFDSLLDTFRADALSKQMVAFVIRNKRVALLPDIAQAYRHQLTAFRGEREAEIITAAPLSAARISEIAKALAQAAGQDVRLTTKTDPSLLGGIMIKMGSLLLDRSVAGRLQRLQSALRASAT